MIEYYGIYDNTVNRWIVDGNTLIHYPVKEIAEEHLKMVKSKNNDFIVKKFNTAKPSYTENKKNK